MAENNNCCFCGREHFEIVDQKARKDVDEIKKKLSNDLIVKYDVKTESLTISFEEVEENG